MTRKSLLMVVLAAFVGVFFMAGLLVAADVPEDVNIHFDTFKKKIKGPVKLSHKKHSEEYKISCDSCHHVYEDGKNVWKEGDAIQKCNDCHEFQKNKETGALKLKNAMHRNCQGCHKDLEKAGKPTGPAKKCDDCHGPKE